MSEQPDHEIEPVAADPDALPRPEEEVAGVRDADPDGVPPADQPAAGGSAGGPPAQGEGAADSW